MRTFCTLPVLTMFVFGITVNGVGCSSKKKEDRIFPVSGTAKVEGELLPVGWIVFYPDEERGNKNTALPFADIKSDGSYELFTNGKPGAALGHYKVVVGATRDPLPAAPTFDESAKKPQWLMAEKYLKPETTDLFIEVVEKPGPGQYDLILSR